MPQLTFSVRLAFSDRLALLPQSILSAVWPAGHIPPRKSLAWRSELRTLFPTLTSSSHPTHPIWSSCGAGRELRWPDEWRAKRK
jgi:hypothetical protein